MDSMGVQNAALAGKLEGSAEGKHEGGHHQGGPVTIKVRDWQLGTPWCFPSQGKGSFQPASNGTRDEGRRDLSWP